MNTGKSKSFAPTPPPGGESFPFWRLLIGAWNRFWFTPADPTILSWIRIGCGLLVLYTLIAYTPELQNFFGRHALLNLDVRLKTVREVPDAPQEWNWFTVPEAPKPPNAAAEKYMKEYQQKWGRNPPLPWPLDDNDPTQIDKHKVDEIDAFYAYWGVDKREAHTIGFPAWSIWFHVTEPMAMLALHCLFITVVALFTLGFCCRITSVMSWFILLCYMHRSPVTLFGVDTMMLITLTYLMIGPCGAALSLDRLIIKWWRKRQPHPEDNGTGDERPAKTHAANFAIRMLQVHLCFIYAAAGLAKLKGTSWWGGTAVWGTLANQGFAPMHSPVYMTILHMLAYNQFIFHTFLLCGTYFTLFFEITYTFLIWNRYTRWLILFMALILHGVIGMFMGLRTFAFIMLVMNLVFLPAPVMYGVIGLFKKWRPLADAESSSKRDHKKDKPEIAEEAETPEPADTHIKEVSAPERKRGTRNRLKRKK